MSFVTWKIVHTPYEGTTWNSANSTDLSTFYDPIVRVNVGDARDSFQFKVTNTSGDFDNFFKPQDRIEIYRVVNSTTTASSDLLMVGAVQKVPTEQTSNSNLLRVEGYNYSEAILSGITFVDVTNRTIPQAFQDALNQVQTYNSNFAVTWASSINPSTKTDGSAFPTIGEKWFNQPLKRIFEDWSTERKTEDAVPYYWYVNSSNEFVWLPASQTVSSTFNSDTDAYRSIKIGKDANDVKNWVIVKGGLDPDGKAIQARVDDLASIAKHGLRYYIITDLAKTAGNLVDDDKLKAGVTDMKDATYSFTPTWTASSYASYADYVEGLREYVKEICRTYGRSWLEDMSKGKLKIDVEFAPGKGWVLGDVIQCTIPELSKSGGITEVKNLRVVDIQYSTDGDLYSLEEDIGTI